MTVNSNGNNTSPLAEEERKIKLDRMRIENLSLLGDVLKKFIEDFGKLIAIVGIILTMLSNLGLIIYNANTPSNDKEKILNVPEVSSVPITSKTPTNTLIPESTITSLGSTEGKGMASIVKRSRSVEGYFMRKIKHDIFNGNNIMLLIFTGVFGIPLFFKKKKKKEALMVMTPVTPIIISPTEVQNACADTSTNIPKP
jgi:hypothetical protein